MSEPQQDLYQIMLVCKHDGKEVGRIPAIASNAEAYMRELTMHYGKLEVEHVHDEDAGFLAEPF